MIRRLAPADERNIPGRGPLASYRPGITQPHGESVAEPGDSEMLGLVRQIASGIYVLSNQLIIRPGMLGEEITVGPNPTQIFKDGGDRSILILNPATPAGVTRFVEILDNQERPADGDTTATPIGVANYETMALFLDIEDAGGTSGILIDIMTQDPLSENWATVDLDVFNAPTAQGTYYAPLGSRAIDMAFAVFYDGGGGTPIWSLSGVLKIGLPGTSDGINKTLYVGPQGITTASGFPMLEGQRESFFVEANTAVFATAAAELPIRVFRF